MRITSTRQDIIRHRLAPDWDGLLIWLLVLFLCAGQAPLHAADDSLQVTAAGTGARADCIIPANRQMTCQLFLAEPGTDITLEALAGDQPIDGPAYVPYPADDDHTELLFVIDKRSWNDAAIAKQHHLLLSGLFASLEPHHQARIALYANNGYLAGLGGSSAGDLMRIVRSDTAAQSTADPQKTITDAIDMLSGSNAQRRGLVIISDTETHIDGSALLDRMQHKGIVVLAVGSIRSPTTNLELDKLARGTLGRFHTMNDRGIVSGEFLANPYRAADSGGSFNVDLNRLPPGDKQTLLLNIRQQENLIAQVQIPLPSATRKMAVQQAADLSTQPVRLMEHSTSQVQDKLLLDYLLPFTAVLFILAGILLLVRSSMRQGAATPDIEDTAEAVSQAWIIHPGATAGGPFELNQPKITIGRNADNDIHLNDASVSRYHAEIEHRADGCYAIADLESLNGVYINNRHVRSTLLRHGDLIEIGDVKLYFSTTPDQQPDTAQ